MHGNYCRHGLNDSDPCPRCAIESAVALAFLVLFIWVVIIVIGVIFR